MTDTPKTVLAYLTGLAGTALSAGGYAETLNAVYLVLCILSVLTSIVLTCFILFVKYKAYKGNDGKIDAEEAKDLIDTAQKGADEVGAKIDETKKKD